MTTRIIESIKENWPSWRPKLIILACLGGAFISGYGAGKAGNGFNTPAHRQLNYTTKSADKPVEEEQSPATKPTATGDSADCPVKGNISSKSKIYHIKGGAFYDRTTAEMCFATEAEAQAAGFTKSSR